LRLLRHALLLVLGLGGDPLFAQTAAPGLSTVQARFAELQARIEEKAQALSAHPGFRQLSPRQRSAAIEFLTGNMLFVAAHEMGHAVISEFELPIVAREEDAADSLAIIGGLRAVANDFSHRVLEAAAWGLFWAARRDQDEGETPAYYGRHGLNEQRAYLIVCLMVGSDPVRFKALADETKLPEDRRRSCGWDFDTAARSWTKLLTPHRRADRPKALIEVSYREAKGELALFAEWFRSIRFLEIFAEVFADLYVWPAPIKMEMRSCGEPGARWTIPSRTLHICYEMAQEFAELHQAYGRESRASRPIIQRPLSTSRMRRTAARRAVAPSTQLR
jgi:Putative metallopeptidase